VNILIESGEKQWIAFVSPLSSYHLHDSFIFLKKGVQLVCYLKSLKK